MRLTHACAVAAADDLPAIRVLRAALDRHHPEVLLTVAALPGSYASLHAISGVEAVPIADLAAGLLDDVVDLPVALAKTLAGPLLLERALRDEVPSTLLLAADCDVRAPLTAIERALDRSDVVALTRFDGRLPADGARPDADDLLAAGEVDDTTVAVRSGPAAESCVGWWLDVVLAAVTRDGHAAIAPPNLLSTAARAWPGVEVLVDGGCGFSAWNAHERRLTRDSDGRLLAAGRGLQLVRFAGFRPDRPWWLSDEASRVRVLDDPLRAQLCRERAAALLDAGWVSPGQRGSSGDGLTPLQRDPRVQRMLRAAARAGERIGACNEPGGEVPLLTWLAASGPAGAAAGVNRYSHDVWVGRVDVRAAFPDLDGPDGVRFAAWLWDHGRDEAQLDERLLPARPGG